MSNPTGTVTNTVVFTAVSVPAPVSQSQNRSARIWSRVRHSRRSFCRCFAVEVRRRLIATAVTVGTNAMIHDIPSSASSPTTRRSAIPRACFSSAGVGSSRATSTVSRRRNAGSDNDNAQSAAARSISPIASVAYSRAAASAPTGARSRRAAPTAVSTKRNAARPSDACAHSNGNSS